jgi:hypothetical protein
MMPVVGGPFGVRMPLIAGAVSTPRELTWHWLQSFC